MSHLLSWIPKVSIPSSLLNNSDSGLFAACLLRIRDPALHETACKLCPLRNAGWYSSYKHSPLTRGRRIQSTAIAREPIKKSSQGGKNDQLATE
jgi:hypothetical protein